MKEIIERNRGLFRRARELNARAGRDVFPVPTRAQLAEVLEQALGGATRLADIPNPEALRLPDWDEVVVENVLKENPDTVLVLGRAVEVEYRAGYNPRVRLDFQEDQSRQWLQLPDIGIHLPGGREVSMHASLDGYGYYIESASSQFKAKARECLNQGLWEKWQKPELPTPTESIAPILEMEYGRCVVSDTPLIAYGAVNYDSWYGSWKSYWSRDRIETEQVHAQASAKFLEVKEKVVRDALKKRVDELYTTYYYNDDMPEGIRARLYSTYYGYSGGATTVAEITAFIAEVEAAVVTAEERKAAAARRQAALDNPEWGYDSAKSSGNRYHGDGVVVTAGGEIVPADGFKNERGASFVRTLYVQIPDGAIAVSWTWDNRSSTVLSASFAVYERSPKAATEAQFRTLAEIESERGLKRRALTNLFKKAPMPRDEPTGTLASASALSALASRFKK